MSPWKTTGRGIKLEFVTAYDYKELIQTSDAKICGIMNIRVGTEAPRSIINGMSALSSTALFPSTDCSIFRHSRLERSRLMEAQ